ncbi:MAG: N-acetyltransferase [Deltaproteobacteria bacterium]|nr:N-acetyltransferase [Deltaproteobacteria bacterium]
MTDAVIHSSAVVHPTAVIDTGASIGPGTKVWHFCHVMSGARVGAGCVLGQNVFVGAAAVVGDGCRIQNNVSLYDGVHLEDDVFVGPSAVFTNVIRPRAFISRKTEFRQTRVGRGATIGANATIVCGRKLGTYCFVAAGAVVAQDVPAYALVMGTPARWRGWVCRCAATLTLPLSTGADAAVRASQIVCGACGARYRLVKRDAPLSAATETAGDRGADVEALEDEIAPCPD